MQVSGADKSIVLDLNGKSIVADETIGAKVTDGAKLTVRDSAEGGKIQLVKYGFEVVGDTKYTDGSKPDPSNAVSSTLTLEGGTIANSGGYAATVYPYGNGATINVTGGTIENTYANGAVDGGFAVSGNGTRNGSLDYGGIAVNVTGGTIKSAQDCAMYLPGYGDVSITGGTVDGLDRNRDRFRQPLDRRRRGCEVDVSRRRHAQIQDQRRRQLQFRSCAGRCEQRGRRPLRAITVT